MQSETMLSVPSRQLTIGHHNVSLFRQLRGSTGRIGHHQYIALGFAAELAWAWLEHDFNLGANFGGEPSTHKRPRQPRGRRRRVTDNSYAQIFQLA